MITDAAVFASLTGHSQMQPAVDELIDKANAAGGKDNITVVTMQVPGGKAAAVPGPQAAKPAGSSRGLRIGLPLILGGLALIFLLGAVGVGAAVFFNRTNNDVVATVQVDEDPEATATTFVQQPAGNPATAAVLLTLVNSEGGGDTTGDLQATPRVSSRPYKLSSPIRQRQCQLLFRATHRIYPFRLQRKALQAAAMRPTHHARQPTRHARRTRRNRQIRHSQPTPTRQSQPIRRNLATHRNQVTRLCRQQRPTPLYLLHPRPRRVQTVRQPEKSPGQMRWRCLALWASRSPWVASSLSSSSPLRRSRSWLIVESPYHY